MNKFIEFFRRDHESLVKIFEDKIEVVNTLTGLKKSDAINYYNLYESRKGRRRVAFSSTAHIIDRNRQEKFAKHQEIYLTKITRWLSGRYDPEIPRYSEIAEEDTANALRGHV